jgi:aldose 1-epimerase
VSDDPLDRLRLVDDAGSLEATFVPAAGMLCCSLRHRGQELLAQNDGVDAYAQRGRTMGVPLLYPWANRLAGFDYEIGGQTVTVPHDPARVALDGNGLPIHGAIGGRLAFEPSSAPGAQDGSLSAALRWDASRPELFELFPFAHDVRYTARLAESCLTIVIEIHASGADAVPVAFGFHPYLAPPGGWRERWLVALPPMRGLQVDEQQIPVGPGPAYAARRLELGQQAFDDGFDSLKAGARFSVVGGGRRIEVRLREGYPCAQVYAPAASTFICFEPMTAPANALVSGDGLRLLAAGERLQAAFSLAVTDADQEPSRTTVGARGSCSRAASSRYSPCPSATSHSRSWR